MKDIDKKITSFLYEMCNKIAGLSINNNILQPKSGGTGNTSLSDAFPSMVKDSYKKTISKNNINVYNGYTLESDSNFYINVNEKSMYIEGVFHITRREGVTSNNVAYFYLNKGGYDIKNIKIGKHNALITINDNKLILSFNFGTDNEIKTDYMLTFVPFV